MATAFTSGASIPSSNPWTPSTTHGETDSNHNQPLAFLDSDDPSAYEDSPTTPHPPNGPPTNGHPHPPNGHLHPPPPPFPTRRSSLPPGPTRAPLPIALHSTFLSLLLSTSLLLTLYLLPTSPLWRLPFFALTLSTFHLLEFYTTALYNPLAATTAAFLLDNGRAYNVAHSAAFLECAVHYTFFPPASPTSTTTTIGAKIWSATVPLGVALLLLGQVTRTLAMAHAGANFNHVVQAHKLPSHTLVTRGVYAWLRHPAYFGFFWWSLGTQLVLGNVVCFVGFAVVLGGFFRRRVRREEDLLVRFFGEEYVRYRTRTRVGIPFVG